MQQSQMVLLGSSFSKAIETPQKCLCTYDPTISAHRCSFTIKNISNHTIHLSICSTFLHYLQLQSPITSLNSQQTKQISVKIRPPNQIYPNEFIGICYSQYELAQHLAVFNPDCIKTTVKLQFDSEIMEDAEIDAILRQCSESQHQEAKGYLSSCQYKKAIEKSEESFTLYRKNLSCLVTMSDSQLKLGNFTKSSKIIQLLLHTPQHPQYQKSLILKSESALNILNLSNTKIPRKLWLIKNMMYLLKQSQSSSNSIIDEQYEKRASKLMAMLQNIRQQLIAVEHDGLFHELLENSVRKFQSSGVVKEIFRDRQEFFDYVDGLVNRGHKNQDQTPQYALDPVNYELFVDPVITPTGTSFQKDFMVNFFKKHGPQDPLTRTYLDPASIVSNTTLKILVRNNPNLAQWIKYQQEATKM